MTYLLFFLLIPFADLAIFVWVCLAFAAGWFLSRRRSGRAARLTTYALLLTLSLTGCAALDKFAEHDKKLSVQGLYTVAPQYGTMLGLGVLEYETKTPANEERLKKLEEQLDTLQKILSALVAKLYSEPDPKSKNDNSKLGL